MWYRDLNYARGRLEGTIVSLTDGTPIRIDRICDDWEILYHNLYTRRDERGRRGDIDLTPITLGYINYSGQAMYLYRQPRRDDWKQGLRRNTLLYKRIGRSDGRFDSIPLNELAECVRNNYPSVSTAVAQTQMRDRESVAVSRTFSVDHNGSVHYKNMFVVGSVYDNRINLSEEFDYLQEELEEVAA